jgi:hypothetical protein
MALVTISACFSLSDVKISSGNIFETVAWQLTPQTGPLKHGDICTTCFNIQNLYTMPIQCVLVFILTVNSSKRCREQVPSCYCVSLTQPYPTLCCKGHQIIFPNYATYS